MTDLLGDRQPMANRLLGRLREAGRDVVTIAMAKKKKKSRGRERQKQPLITHIHRVKAARIALTPAGSGGPIEGRVRETTPAERVPAAALTRGVQDSGTLPHKHLNQKRDAHILHIFGGNAVSRFTD